MVWRNLIIASIIIGIVVYGAIEIYSRNLISKGKKLLESIDKDFKIEDEKFISIPKYYINLDRSIERRQKLEKEFKKYNINNYTRIKAFDKKDIKTYRRGELEGTTYVNDYYAENHEVAITMSHLKAIKTAYDNGDKEALIFEDDVSLQLYPTWKKSFSSIIKSLPGDAEILQMVSNKKIDILDFALTKRPNDVSTHGCAGAYLINKKGMEKIIDNFFLEDGTIIFKRSLDLPNIRIDFGVFNFMNIYTINCNLFLMYNFENEQNTYQRSQILRFIERDYDTIKYLTDNN